MVCCFRFPGTRWWYWSYSLVALLTLPHAAPAQAPPPGTDYLAPLKTKDLSRLWRADRLVFYGTPGADVFPEPLGFIGANYQRFYLHYTSVRPAPGQPYVYQVSGKTRVKTNVCAFTGTITVVKARLYKAPNAEHPQLREGELTCRVELAEDRRQPGSGTLSGTLTTYFYLDAKGQPQYNSLEPMDGFSNNQCVATWTSYATRQRKPCHWGDFKIPESGDLDFSVSDFEVAAKYVPNGWQTYMAALEG
ncbi:MAG TPA: hypothetical protein VFO93_05935 [Hymenobacter sp.]|uniref:hypothetical protein n=1 Tax=Hymenobacter sp. TaxID=1898978 RepID=UPI002D80DEB1|nr:hypothetical protein [Hymenobacter sp.]HET9503058.1 hypothetical protein [Hymenobacter sp.]